MKRPFFIPPHEALNAKEGDKAIIELGEWKDTCDIPRGKVLRVLGRAGEHQVEMHAILAEFGLPLEFPESVEKASEEIVNGVTAAEIANRRDVRTIPTITIDPDDAKDLDDALSVRRLESGLWEVGVHIADVSHYVRPKSVVDMEAANRATSVYLVDRVVPMLPEKLQLEAEQALAGVSAAVARADALLVDRALRKAEARLKRRAVAIAGDITKMSGVTALAARAVNLVPAARKAQRGETEFRGPDYENGGEIVLPIDPGKAPQAQLESLFARAKRMKAGREAAEARLSETRRASEALRAIRATLAEAPSLDAEQIADLRNRAKAVAPKDVSFGAEGTAKSSRGAPQKHNAFRRFRTPRGLVVLVGKGSADNDELTFRIASPHDLWLHAKDRRGAHVIVPLRKSEALPDGALVDAATLAAHFSDARDEALVDVQYTSRKYVRKMKGGAAGAVVVEREKVLVLRVDKGKVAELLDGEEA